MRYREILEACWKGYHKEGNKKMFGKSYPNCVKNKAKNESSLTEFAPDAGDDDGNDGFNDETLKMLAAKWYNGDEDPRVEATLAAIGWEIGQDEGYDDEPGVFVVQAGDVDGKSYISWPADELRQSVAEGARVARKAGQPAGSKKHSDLYTDENPRGTITGLKFATVEDARASVTKIRNSGRSHAHKIQAAVAMEQRARAAGKASEAAVYRAYINANKKTNEQQLDEKCWDGYSQQGMKKKGDRMVPNCVSMSEQELEEDLRKWFKQKWVRFGPDGKIRGDCARDSESEGKPKCLPQAKAQALGKKGRASAASRKRRQDPDANRKGAAINVATKKK